MRLMFRSRRWDGGGRTGVAHAVRVMAVTAIALAAAASIASCSSNFSSSVSGTVYEKDGETPFPDVYVYAYVNALERDSDYDGFRADMEKAGDPDAVRTNSDSYGNFYPVSGRNVMRAQTGSDGSFTVSRILWSSAHPKFGKDGDIREVYFLYFSPYAGDISSDDPAVRNGLVKGERTATIVSDSANQFAIKVQLDRKSFRLSSGISGSIRDVSDGTAYDAGQRRYDVGKDSDDDVRLSLLYLKASGDAGEGGGDANGGAFAWKSVYEDMKKDSGRVVTVSDTTVSGETVLVSHGNFSGLGSGAVFDLSYDDPYRDGYVWMCIKADGKNADKEETLYSKPFRVTLSNSDSVVKNLSRAEDMLDHEPTEDDLL